MAGSVQTAKGRRVDEESGVRGEFFDSRGGCMLSQH